MPDTPIEFKVKQALPKTSRDEVGNEMLIDFLDQCLVLDPSKRLTAT